LGAYFVAQRGCAGCHRSGDTRFGTLSGRADRLSPGNPDGATTYGSNLTSDAESGLGRWSDAQIIRALREGLDFQLRPLCSPPMPRYPEMSDHEASSVVLHLRSLPVVSQRIAPSVCPGQAVDLGGGD
jgi:hypothetical protein